MEFVAGMLTMLAVCAPIIRYFMRAYHIQRAAAGRWEQLAKALSERKQKELETNYTYIIRDDSPIARFADASLARMALVMFQSNEAAAGNTAHQWTMDGTP